MGPNSADVFVGSQQRPSCLLHSALPGGDSEEVGFSYCAGVETMQSWLLSCCRCRHENDSDLYCAFDPDVAHMLAGWGLDWRQTHCLGQATVEVGLWHMQGHA